MPKKFPAQLQKKSREALSLKRGRDALFRKNGFSGILRRNTQNPTPYPMDVDSLRRKVTESRLLTERERDYWLQKLPNMTQEQLMKLDRILTEALGIVWSEQMDGYLKMIDRAANLCQQKLVAA
jgi:hypothetical protein